PVRMRRTTDFTPSRRWLVPRYVGAAAASAATASLRIFDGPDPKRPSDGNSSGGSRIASPSSGDATRPTVPIGFRPRTSRLRGCHPPDPGIPCRGIPSPKETDAMALTVLVAGATGRFRPVAELLLERGHRVRAG